MDPEPAEALEPGLQQSYGHLHPGSCSVEGCVVGAGGQAQGKGSIDGADWGTLCHPAESQHNLLWT